jgi:hypothetical protein
LVYRIARALDGSELLWRTFESLAPGAPLHSRQVAVAVAKELPDDHAPLPDRPRKKLKEGRVAGLTEAAPVAPQRPIDKAT